MQEDTTLHWMYYCDDFADLWKEVSSGKECLGDTKQ